MSATATGARSERDSATRGTQPTILCENLVRIFKIADLEAVALQGLDLTVEQGDLVAVVGASGSGKSTLLNILGGLDVPTAGRAMVAGRDLGRITRRERTAYRRRTVGMVWQQTARNLVPYLSAQENVQLPMLLDGRAHRAARAKELLALVGQIELGLVGPAADRAERVARSLGGGAAAST